jgi:2OG-Fe(II) oxygenase superfamily
MVDIITIDDAIPKAYQDQVEAELASTRMTWFFHEESARSTKTQFDTNFAGFSHPAFNIREPNPVLSPLNAVLVPILFLFCEKAGLPFTALLRVRIGLFTSAAIDAPHHNPHVDFYEPHHTALYYVNDSDGDSVVFNETYQDVPAPLAASYVNEGKLTIADRISPRKGRMAAFDGKHYHASMHPATHVSRIVVTFNFR